MLRKFSISFLASALVLTGSLIVAAQNAPVRGRVELKKSDGTLTPVANALVEVYRTDVKSKLPSAKTNKKGEFVFAGLPLGAIMTFSVSGEGIKAELYPGVKAGREDVNIVVYEGDGKALTEDEVRNALNTAPTQGQGGQESEEARKAREEYEKKVAEVTAKNKKVEQTNAIIKNALEAGSKAFQDKNYDLAIAKFQEGIDADPDFAGSATVLNNNKALALRLRGFDAYKQGTADPGNKASWLEKAKNDFTNSIAASQRTADMISKLDAVEAPKFSQAKYASLSNSVEAHRLMIATGADTSRLDEAVAALSAYLAVETDPALKVKNQINLADGLRLAGNTAAAIPIYRSVLELEPNNTDAIGSLGLCLFAEGAGAANKEQMQEGLNLMQRFTDTAPDKPGDAAYTALKQSIAESVKYLKEQEKLVPQKSNKPTPAKGKKP